MLYRQVYTAVTGACDGAIPISSQSRKWATTSELELKAAAPFIGVLDGRARHDSLQHLKNHGVRLSRESRVHAWNYNIVSISSRERRDLREAQQLTPTHDLTRMP